MLVALVTFGVVCHDQMPCPDASAAKSCDAELAVCQALLGTVRSKKATGVVRLAVITPSSNPNGDRIRPPPFGLRMRGLHAHEQPVPCRVECARRQAHERHGPAGRRRAVCRVDCNELRGEAAGVSSARQCAQAVDQRG